MHITSGIVAVLNGKERPPRWLATSVQKVTLKVKETLHAPDLQLVEGAWVDGKVRYADGKPAKDVLVTATGTDFSNAAITDAHGQYRIHLPAGMYKVTVGGMPIPHDYQRDASDVRYLTIANTQVSTLPPFQVKKAFTLSAQVVNTDGQPIAGVKLVYQVGNVTDSDYRFGVVSTDEHGQFTITGLGKCVVTFSIPDAGADQQARPAWAFADANPVATKVSVHPPLPMLSGGEVTMMGYMPGDHILLQQIQIHYAGMPAAEPVKIILRKIKWLTSRGRVITPDGKPLPDVSITFGFRSHIERVDNFTSSYNAHTEEVKTDKDGQFAISDVAENETPVMTKIDKPGYTQLCGGQVRRNGDAFIISDIQLTDFTSELMVQVLDERMQPAPNAHIFISEPFTEMQGYTDLNGIFRAARVRPGNILVFAATEGKLGWGPVSGPAAHATIVLQPIANLLHSAPSGEKARIMARDDLAGLWKAARDTDYYARQVIPQELAPYDLDGALAMVSGQVGAVPDAALAGVIIRFVQAHPEQAEAKAAPLLAQVQDPALHAGAAVAVAQALLPEKPAQAAQLYASAKTQVAAGAGNAQAAGYARLAKLAALLKNGEEEEMLGKAIAAAKEFSAYRQLPLVAELAAEIGLAPATRVLAELPEQARTEIGLSPAARVLAESLEQTRIDVLPDVIAKLARVDAPAAQRLFASLKLEEFGTYTEERLRQLTRALVAVVRAVAAVNPEEALELARQTKPPLLRSTAIMVAAEYQRDPVRRGHILQTAVTVTLPDHPLLLARIAARLYPLDHQAGRALFADAWRLIIGNNARDEMRTSDWASSNIAGFAYYYRVVDPLESRMWLEAEYGRLRNFDGGQPTALLPVVLAMAALDYDEAGLISRQQSTFADRDTLFDIRRKLCQYLLADDAVRNDIDFERWCQADSWVP